MGLTGSSTGAIESARRSRRAGFKSYIDSQVAGAVETPRPAAEAPNSDSKGDPDSPASFALEESMSRQLLKLPTRDMAHSPSDIVGGYRAMGGQYLGRPFDFAPNQAWAVIAWPSASGRPRSPSLALNGNEFRPHTDPERRTSKMREYTCKPTAYYSWVPPSAHST